MQVQKVKWRMNKSEFIDPLTSTLSNLIVFKDNIGLQKDQKRNDWSKAVFFINK